MNFFGFIDETGILQDTQDQPYFALGLLRLKDTSDLFQQIMSIKARHRGIYIEMYGSTEFEIGELKFSKLKNTKYLNLYKDIIDACFEYSHFYFSARVIDKNKSQNNNNQSTWDLQIKLSKYHIKQHCKDNHQIAIVADYLNRPKDKPSFESEINKVKNVFNSCMLESNSSIFVQIVDILIGAIVYRYKHPDENKRLNRNPKMKLAKHIEQKLHEIQEKTLNENKQRYKKSLKGTFYLFADNFYFSVYDK